MASGKDYKVLASSNDTSQNGSYKHYLFLLFSAGIWCDTYTHKRQQQQQKCELLTSAKVSSPRAPLPLGNIYINEL